MFYFLIYQSSITEYYDTEKKYLTSFFWGTIAYIFSHALFTSSTAPFAIQLKKSFWLILLIDIGVLLYMYQYVKNKESADSDSSMVDDLLKKMSIGVSRIESNLNDIKQSENDDSDDEEPLQIIHKNSKNQHKKNQEIIRKDSLKSCENIDFYEFDNEIENRTKNLEKKKFNLIIPPHENNMDFPAQTLSTPLNQLMNDNNDNNDNTNDNQSITLDVNYEDDSGSDIDVDQFEDFIK
jgi:hypothetical protein